MAKRSEVERQDVYERVTSEIVRAIEQGVESFEMPWHQRSNGLPRNAATGRQYRGINVLSLWSAERTQGYGLPYWGTYQQWRTLNAQVRQGEHGTHIVFYLPKEQASEEEPAAADSEKTSRVVVRSSVVFNAAQVEGWAQPLIEGCNIDDQLALAETFVNTIGAQIQYGGDRAYYSPKRDLICMPDKASFRDTAAGSRMEAFYSVLLHEHIHWTGHERRVNRNLTGRFGSESYAMEELVAELGAAFQCGMLGISSKPRPDHASYIANWLQVLKEQKSAIFTAASAAAQACLYLEELFLHNDAKLSETTR